MGMLIGAICIAPFGVAHAGAALFKPEILPTAIAVAFLSSALPYSLEMYAMTRVPARIFGVLMSLDPALAAAAGLVLLGERLSWLQWSAIGCIVFASAGSAAGHKAEPR
jgi:inner membrane transporter RhtA